MQAGELKEVVDIQRLVVGQDDTGQPTSTYATLYEGVRAKIVPLSGREYIAARQVVADVTTRIMIRRYRNVKPTCRLVRVIEDDSPPTTEIYDITAILPDADGGREYLTLMCVQRIAEGWRRGE